VNNLIGVIDYGMSGNIHSVKKAIKLAGGDVVVVSHPDQLNAVDKIILPGVGNFKDAMERLHNIGFVNILKITDKPVLGICLGMQLLSTIGYEYGITKGLDIIQAEVKPILAFGEVPHVGFNTIEVLKDNELLYGIEGEEFYFMHSFEVINYTNIISLTEYVGHTFVSAMSHNNIYGVQFHPEKSRDAGIELFRNFIKLDREM
jgi:imidazole glycerol phosphate synthase glutamine amidotransferase subunit